MITALRGTADILPPATALWQFAEHTARDLFARYGYAEIRTPVFEQTELFVRSIGDTTDIVEKEMYTFADKKGRSLTLRPEGTACVVRACLEHKLFAQARVQKYYYLGPMFRYERPQAGRQRQFHQIGVELFGSYSPLADAEVISLMVRFFEAAGISGLSVNINSLGDADSRAAYRDLLREFIEPKAGQLCPDCQRRIERNVLRVLDCKVPLCKEALEAPGMPTTVSALSGPARAHYQRVLESLTAMGIPFREDARLVRGLDYYTHTIFEVTHTALGAQDAMGGGGRYDGLIEQMGGPATGGVGFALGVERLVIALQHVARKAQQAAKTVYLVSCDEPALAENLVLADALRRAGITALAGYEQQSMKAQLRHANAAGARWAVIRGSDERAQGAVRLKNMETGDEALVPTVALVEKLRETGR